MSNRHPRDAPLLRRWQYAAKPASWPKLLVPFVLGQAIGLTAGQGPSLAAFAAGLAFTVLDLLFIVFLNDWGDRDVDAIKRRMFPDGCSPKTIPDGILSARQLLIAGLACGAAALAVAFAAGLLLDRPWLGPMAVVALGVFVAYTLPPARLNYRGGGELLEVLGVAVTLPWMQAYLQGGELLVVGLWVLPGFALFALSSAIASGLSDERSDRRGGKTTVVSTFGNALGRRLVEIAMLAGAVVWLVTDAPAWWITTVPAVIVLFETGWLITLSREAVTDAFAAQGRYKARQHEAMWRAALVASMFLAWWSLS